MVKQVQTRAQTQAETSLLDARLRVGVAAGDPLRLLGFQAIFDGHLVVQIVPVAVDEPLQERGLDVVILAAQNPDQMFEWIRTLRAGCCPVHLLVMGRAQEPEFIERVLRVGAHGYLTVNAELSEMEDAIAAVYDGGVWVPSKASRDAATGAAEAEAMLRPEAFTVRERQVMTLLMAGQSNREIAQGLKIEERTVKSHVARLLKKMGVRNRTALTMQAIARGLVITAE